MRKQPIYNQELGWKSGKGFYWKEQAFEVNVPRKATLKKCKNNSLVICWKVNEFMKACKW